MQINLFNHEVTAIFSEFYVFFSFKQIFNLLILKRIL